MNNFQTGTVKTSSFEAEYIRIGDGASTLVLIPGMNLDSFFLVAEDIADLYSIFMDYTIWLIDRPLVLQDNTSAVDMSEMVIRCCDVLGIDSFDLAGISLGGMIAQCIAINHPGRVRKLVLVATMPRQNDISRKTFPVWSALGAEGDVSSIYKSFGELVYSPEMVKLLEPAFRKRADKATENQCHRWRIMADACGSFDMYNKLSLIKGPALVLGGGNDLTLGVTGTHELIREIPCESYIYPLGVHGFFDEEPDFRDRVYAFLSKK